MEDKITHLMGFTESETAEILKDQNEEEAMAKRVCRGENDPNMTTLGGPAPQHTPTQPEGGFCETHQSRHSDDSICLPYAQKTSWAIASEYLNGDLALHGIHNYRIDAGKLESAFLKTPLTKTHSSDQKKIKALVEAAQLAHGLLLNLLTDSQLDFQQLEGWTARQRLNHISSAIQQAGE